MYYPVFKAMEEEGMVLNLHGEVPSDHEKVSGGVWRMAGPCLTLFRGPSRKRLRKHSAIKRATETLPSAPDTSGDPPSFEQSTSYCPVLASDAQNISILNAEKHFLTHLRTLASAFPKLRIVLEHATTSEAIAAVTELPPNVACSITAHHLFLTIDTVAPQPHHFCKPLAKEPKDRDALQDAVKSGNPKFFLGSDSAPHPSSAKSPRIEEFGEPVGCAAGVYTSPILLPLVATLLESFGALDKLEGFISGNGRKFYGVPAKEGEAVKLRRTAESSGKVPGVLRGEEGVEVVPFWAGKQLGWEIVRE